MKESRENRECYFRLYGMGLHEIVYNSKIFVHIIAILIRLYNKFADIFMQWLEFQ